MQRLIEEHKLTPYLAGVLVSRKALSDYYERVVQLSGVKGDKVASYIVNDLLGWIPEESPSLLWQKIPPEVASKVVVMLERGEITIKMAKEMVPELLKGRDPEEIVRERGWSVLRDERLLREVVREVFEENERAVLDALTNRRAVQYLVGRAMEKTQKRADPRLLFKIVESMLEEERKRLQTS
uniref:Aspartyl/glutamyl-tRNA(Asn/Gln) amidotransferase subunit B n=1 Tax=Fervidicoccus fontis TaxID=683846 RepID=A0A7J3ZM93_9CREN